MLFLGVLNEAVQELINSRIQAFNENGKFANLEYKLVDFDRVVYYLTGKNSVIQMDFKMNYYDDIVKYGSVAMLKSIYGEGLQEQPTAGYSITLIMDLSQLKEGEADSVAKKWALLKRNCFAALFEKFFETVNSQQTGEKAVIKVRQDESLFMQALSDRVTVIFSTRFKDPTDYTLSKVILQEFVEARRKFDHAPQILLSQRDAPSELTGTEAITGEDVSYLTLVLQPRNFQGTNKEKTIDLVHTLRNYVHYHIKCSKAYLQMRMRAKTGDFVKILNRAKPEEPKNTPIQVLIDSAVGHSGHDSVSYANTPSASARG